MKNKEILLGVHLSVSGGFENLFLEGDRLKINVFQFFLGSPVVWKNLNLKEEDIRLFKRHSVKYKFIVVHAPYLVNLASSQTELRKRSISRVISDLAELRKVSISNYVIHTGSNENIKEGIYNIRKSLDKIFFYVPTAKIILENSAGRKNDIGKNLEEITEIVKGFEDKIGVCIDSCHLFASGVDIRIEDELDDFYESLKKHSLLDKVMLIHLNDSKYSVGSFKDRHWHIGKGEIGIKGFSNLLNHSFFSKLPFILETPKEGDMDRVNIVNVKKIIGDRVPYHRR